MLKSTARPHGANSGGIIVSLSDWDSRFSCFYCSVNILNIPTISLFMFVVEDIDTLG